MKTKIYPIVYPNSLRKYRKAAGLHQHEVARALGLNGCERISKWENGHSIPHIKSLFQMAILYRVSPQELYDEMYQSLVNPTPPVVEHIPIEPEQVLCGCGKHMILKSEVTGMVPYNGKEPSAFWKSDPDDAKLV
jgi:transcriptional regulator with XRE-family HTH domain